MRSARLLVPALVGAMLLGAVALPAVADGGVEVELVPPPGQTAVKIADTVEIDGTVPDGTTSGTASLRAVTAGGAVIEQYDVSDRLEFDGTALSGDFTISCFFIPGCFEGDDELRATVAGYTLDVAAAGGRDVSPRLDLDEQDPFITSYSLVDPSTIVVRFNEDVADPEGDSALDWQVDGQRNVEDVEGFGDQRTLTLFVPVDGDATPEVRYRPQPSLVAQLPNVVYLDGAGNDLLATGRFARAADRVPPPVPTITMLDGREPTTDGEDQPVPVLGSDATPVIVVDDVPAGATVELYLDDGDGRFEADQDTLLDTAPGNGDPLELTPATDLLDKVHRFFTRSTDDAVCDPNDTESERCPNSSGRSAPVVYDLETVDPELVGTATATRTRVVVSLSEAVEGESAPGDWTLRAPSSSSSTPPTVQSVEVDGALVVLSLSGDVEDADQLVYDPADATALRDEHGNTVPVAAVPLVAGLLPVLTTGPVTLTEGDGPENELDVTYTEPTATFTIRLTEPSIGESSVAFELLSGTATVGEDLAAQSGTVEFTDGQSEASVVVESIGDRLDEADEDFLLRLSSPSGVRLPQDASEFSVINDLRDDDLLPGISIDSITLDEGQTEAYTVTLDAPSGRSVAVDWAIVGGDAELGQDVTGGSGTLVFAPQTSSQAGETSKTIEVEALTDGVDEDAESFRVELSESRNATIEDSVGEGSIIDIDAAPQVLVRNAAGFEGQTVRTTVGLRGESERTITVTIVSVDDTATAGEDYEPVETTITIPPGQRQAFVESVLLRDDVDEFAERFDLEPRDAQNARVEDGSTGRVTISDPVANEGDGSDTGTGGADGGSSSGGSTGGGGTPLGAPDDDRAGAPIGSENGLPATGGGAGLLALAALALGARFRRRD